MKWITGYITSLKIQTHTKSGKPGVDFLVDNLDTNFVEYLDDSPTNIITFNTPLYCFADSSISKLHLPFAPGKDLRKIKISADKQYRHVIKGQIITY